MGKNPMFVNNNLSYESLKPRYALYILNISEFSMFNFVLVIQEAVSSNVQRLPPGDKMLFIPITIRSCLIT